MRRQDRKAVRLYRGAARFVVVDGFDRILGSWRSPSAAASALAEMRSGLGCLAGFALFRMEELTTRRPRVPAGSVLARVRVPTEAARTGP